MLSALDFELLVRLFSIFQLVDVRGTSIRGLCGVGMGRLGLVEFYFQVWEGSSSVEAGCSWIERLSDEGENSHKSFKLPKIKQQTQSNSYAVEIDTKAIKYLTEIWSKFKMQKSLGKYLILSPLQACISQFHHINLKIF